MRRVRCPECDTKVKVPDNHERSFIRCTSCREKIPLDDADDVVKKRPKSQSQPWGCLGLAAGATALGALVCVGVAFIHPAISFILAPLLGIAIGLVAFVVGIVFWLRAGGRGESRFKALAPWLGIQFMGALILIGPFVILEIARKVGWLPPPAPRDEVVKGPPGGAPPGKDVGPDKKIVKDPPKVEKSVPLKWSGDAALDKTLADLADQDGKRFKPAIDSLIAMAPNKHRSVVAQHLAEQLRTSPVYNRTTLLRALGIWATAQEIPVLIKMLSDQDINTRNETLEVLSKLKDGRAAGPMAQCLLEVSTQNAAEKSLKAMGPIAEREVIPLLKDKDQGVRWAAIRVLKDIGTQESVPVLQAAAASNDQRALAQEALAAIAERSKK